MDYQKHYEQLIAKHGSQDKPDGYSERHHILPKSMGGSDDASNLVYLSAKAHFVAHHLLWRWHRNRAMAYAFKCMCVISRDGLERYQPSAVVYQEARAAQAAVMSRVMKNRFVGEKNPMFGKKLSPERRARISECNSGERNHMFGKTHSASAKKKISAQSSRLVHTQVAKGKISEAMTGTKHPRAKPANIYLHNTGEMIARGVVIREWVKVNNYTQSELAKTARGKLEQHKGIYARYI